MKQKTYDRWICKRVRLKSQPGGPIGTVTASTKYYRLWLVEWPDGKRTQVPERLLEIVSEEEFAAQ